MKSKIASSRMYGHIVMMSCCALLIQDWEQRRTKNIVLRDNSPMGEYCASLTQNIQKTSMP